jgi:methylated-DNA-protein-cysteine methyltransferase related protein
MPRPTSARRKKAPPVKPQPEGWAEYYRLIRRIPRGRVATYGAIASLAGRPRSARHVGFALAALVGDTRGVPWHRVMGGRGRGHAGIAIRNPMGGALQRELLEAEGVQFDARDRVDLARFGWARAYGR